MKPYNRYTDCYIIGNAITNLLQRSISWWIKIKLNRVEIFNSVWINDNKERSSGKAAYISNNNAGLSQVQKLALSSVASHNHENRQLAKCQNCVSRDTCAPLRCTFAKLLAGKSLGLLRSSIDKVSFGRKEFLYKWGIIENGTRNRHPKGRRGKGGALNRNARKCV